MILEPLHLIFVLIGVNANALLIVCIIWASPGHIKEYSIILLNSAINDLIADLSDVLTWQRIVFSGTSWANLSFGPCLAIDRDLCLVLTQLLVISLLHSQVLLAISFWYRSRIMVRANFGTWRLQMVLTVALLPTLAHTVLMLSSVSPLKDVQEFVRKTYPFRSVETDHRVLIGFLSILQPRSAVMLGYFAVVPIPLYCYIIHARQKNLRLIERLVFRSSPHVRLLHRRLIQALTYHALLPSAIIISVILFVVMSLLGYDHFELQELVYLPRSAVMLGYFAVIPIPMYCYIIHARQKNLKLIERLVFRSSPHVRLLHRRLIQALTYHALLPSAIFIAVILFVVMSLLGYDHFELQEMVYLSAAVPSILNPIFTIYLIGPYRRFLIRFFNLTPDVKISTTSIGNGLEPTSFR